MQQCFSTVQHSMLIYVDSQVHLAGLRNWLDRVRTLLDCFGSLYLLKFLNSGRSALEPPNTTVCQADLALPWIIAYTGEAGTSGSTAFLVSDSKGPNVKAALSTG